MDTNKVATYKYNVCISFAGEDRGVAHELASLLKEGGRSVFYDDYEKHNLWGKDLYKHLYSVYSELSRFCIILFSEHYLRKAWTNHELRAAQSRALNEKREYILPVKVDDCSLPPEFNTISYLSLKQVNLNEVHEAFEEKFFEVLKNEGWIEEQELIEHMNDFILKQIIVNTFLSQIPKEKDNEEALRKALLSLIYLAQDDVDDSTKAFISYLLLTFSPLSAQFDAENTYAVVPPDGSVLRFPDGSGRFRLLMRQDFWEQKVKEHDEAWEKSETPKKSTKRVKKRNP